MKKLLLLFTGFVSVVPLAFSGGIVTNSNQSAAWIRTMVRDASTDADAVYFNPAGLIKLSDGFHFSLSSQTIFQNKDVSNDYMYLSPTPKMFHGEVTAPVFPSAYAVWKKNRLAISFGFNPIGGGGGATFKKGLPSLELNSADMVPTLASYGATDYRQDVYFKGTSVFFGYQLGVTYKINDMISVFGGVRYVTAKNTYAGHLRDVQVNMSGTWTDVSTEFTNLSVQATMGAGAATSISSSMAALISGGIPGTATLADAEAAHALTADQVAQIEAGLTGIGIDPGLQIAQIEGACDIAAPQLTAAANQASETAQLTGMLFNQEADVTQKGTGITPIIGVNLAINDKINIGLKYEFATKIELTNSTKKDFIIGLDTEGNPITMFPDGAKVRNDMPAMFSAGIDYKILPNLSASAGYHYYWDRTANYGKMINNEYVENSKVIDHNYYEAAVGLEYGITDKLLVSAGYLFSHTGVNKDYQSDLSFSLSSNTIGGGLGFKVNDNLMINAGVAYSKYLKGTKTYDHYFQAGDANIPCTDTYTKNNMIYAIGLDFGF